MLALEDFYSTFTGELIVLTEDQINEELQFLADEQQTAPFESDNYPRAHTHIGREALGEEKYQSLLQEHMAPLYNMGLVGVKLKYSRDGVKQDADGTVIITEENLWVAGGRRRVEAFEPGRRRRIRLLQTEAER